MAITPVELEGKRVLITGATGSVAQPIVEALAGSNEVFAGARYKNAEDRQKIESLGATPVVLDLGASEWHDLPDGIHYVLNLAVAKSGKWEIDLPVNAQALGKLMRHYSDVEAFLHMSSTAVYEYAGREPRTETSPLGDNHRNMFETYSISKIAAETVARFVAEEYGIPLTIARLNVPYGPFPCWPFYQFVMMQNNLPIDVHPDGPNAYSPIHSEDYIQRIPHLLGAACAETTTVNLAGCQVVTVEQWCEYMGEMTGLTPRFNETTSSVGSLVCDTGKLVQIAGETEVDWKKGFRDMLTVLAPEALKQQCA